MLTNYHYRPPSRLFALIIGINDYKSPSIQNLQGAVADADAMWDYLQNDLGVPSPQIRNLRNSDATKDAIIGGIEAFSLNDKIIRGDPILIYYAGHGHSAETPKDWSGWNTVKIELLVPYDYPSLDGDPKCGITDRFFGALLSELEKKKGNNIVRQTFILPEFIYQLTMWQTVILDSCHSNSGTRKLESGDLTGLTPRNIGGFFKSSDSEARGLVGRAIEAKSGFALDSHVLLAACHSTEKAFERTGRGLFTDALLKTLKFIGIDKLKYNTLLNQMPLLGHGWVQADWIVQH